MTSEPPALTLTWTPRAAELADASLARSREVGGTGARAVVGTILGLLAATMFGNRWSAAFGFVLISVALVLVFVRLTAPLLRRRWAGALAANPVLAQTCTVEFDDLGVHLTSDRFSSSRQWSTFGSWSDTPDAVVLATSGLAAAHTLVVPHRAGTSDEVAGLRRLVEHHLGPPQGAAGRDSRRLLEWGARVVVLACLLVPLTVLTARVHDRYGEWRPWPSEAPPRLTRAGTVYDRDGGPVAQPAGVTGSDYTAGGGLVLVSWPPPTNGPAPELWVLAHDGVVHHYVIAG